MTNAKTVKIWGGLLASTMIVSAAAPVVFHATDATANPAVEEIVVISRKREERLQEVPESITAFTSKVIEVANVESVRDFVDMTPNLLIRETFRTNETFLTMRGISSAQGALPPVSIVIDGVQIGSNDFLNQDILDVERIEVLKGPQGALYGQGAIAGAINIVTKKPTNEFEGMVKGSYGNGDSWRIASAVSGPIVQDALYFRVSGVYRKSDGLIKNNRGDNIYANEQGTLRGQLMYENENLKVNLRGSWSDGDGFCCIQDKIPRDPLNTDPSRLIYIDVDNVKLPGVTSNIIGQDDTRFRDASLKIDYDFGDFTLTSVSAWADVRQLVYGDSDFTNNTIYIPALPNPNAVAYPNGTVQDIIYDIEVKNQELRLASNGDGPFQWMFGGFYQDRHGIQDVLVGPLLDNGTILPLNANLGLRTNSEAWGIFGHTSYDITDSLEFAVSLRYDEDKQDSINLKAANPAASFAQAKFSKLQPKVQLSYQWTDDVLTYATYSTGFRAGGFQQNVKFDNETTKNYEVGFKTQFADGLVTLNGSFFHIDYANQFLSLVVFNPSGASVSRTLNIPTAKIDGLELELTARPTENLTVTMGAGLVDSVVKEVKDDPNLFGEEKAKGNKSPLVPPFTFNASFTYAHPITDQMELVFYGAYQRRGGFYFDLANDIYTRTRDFIDGKISLDTEAWSVGVWGKNLTNSRHATNVSITGADLRVPNQPRSYGVEATYRF